MWNTSVPLNALDRGFLALERRGTPTQMAALVEFDCRGRATAADLRADLVGSLEAGALGLPELRRVPKRGLAGRITQWEGAGEVAFHQHLSVDGTASSGDDHRRVVIERFLEQVHVPLTTDHPPWHASILYGGSDDPVYGVVTVHHALADGLRMAEIVAALFGGHVETTPKPAREPLARRPMAIPTSPQHTPTQSARTGATERASLPGSPVKRQHIGGLFRTSAPAIGYAPVQLEVGALGRRLPGTTALLLVVSRALRMLMEQTGQEPEAMRALAAVLTPTLEARTGGNAFAFHVASLPLHERSSAQMVRRLLRQRERRGQAKKYFLAASRAMNALGPLADPLIRTGVRLLPRQRWIDLAVTPLPAPADLSLGGRAATAVFPYVPVVPGVGLVVAAAIGGERIDVGISYDRNASVDGRELAVLFPAAGGQLCRDLSPSEIAHAG